MLYKPCRGTGFQRWQRSADAHPPCIPRAVAVAASYPVEKPVRVCETFRYQNCDILSTKKSRAPTKFYSSCTRTYRKSLKPIILCYRTSRFKLLHLTDSIRNCMGKKAGAYPGGMHRMHVHPPSPPPVHPPPAMCIPPPA